MVRWLVVAISLILLVWFALVWQHGTRKEMADHSLMAAFNGLIDLQVTIGLVLILWSDFAGVGFPRYRIDHAFIMIIAVVVAHLSICWRNAEMQIRARNNVALIVGVLVMVVVGVTLLPQSWIG